MKVIATCFLPQSDYPEKIFSDTEAEFVRAYCDGDEEKILKAVEGANVIITCLTLQPFRKKLLERLSQSVRHIASAGAGFENIDLGAATKKGIVVTNTPLYCIDEVSDHALALILALNRKLFKVDKMARDLKWRVNSKEMREDVLPPMKKLRGQTLGLIGFGNIAKALVKKAQGFGLEVVVSNTKTPKEILSSHFGVRKISLKELLLISDFVSLHVALTDDTEMLLKEEHFRLMKSTAYFINTARGGLISEDALVKALQKGWIAGAGLDVMDKEPPLSDNSLLKMDNVIISGHSAQYSDDAEEKLWRTPIEEALLAIQGKFPQFSVNPEIKEKWLKKWKGERK